MHEVRQIIQRLRLGETNREVARAQRVGRDTVANIRRLAGAQGWLDAASPMPEDAKIAERFKAPGKNPQNISTVEPFREDVLAWHAQGIQVSTMRQALARKHGFAGSAHALYRFLGREAPATPGATVILDFAVAEMAQVDFGSGPVITDRQSGEVFKTWIFVMTLAWSRHQYAEIVRNQAVETWLACHRHAFEWFNGVPKKIRIDNPKCAITRACYYLCQRHYRHRLQPVGHPHPRLRLGRFARDGRQRKNVQRKEEVTRRYPRPRPRSLPRSCPCRPGLSRD